MRTRRRVLISLLATGCAPAAPSFAQTDTTLRLGAIASGHAADRGFAARQNPDRRARRPRLRTRPKSRPSRRAARWRHVEKLPGLIEELKAQGAQILVAAGLSERRRRQSRRRADGRLRGRRRSRRDRPCRELGASRRRGHRHLGRRRDPDRQAARILEGVLAAIEARRDALERRRSRDDAAL